MKALHLLYYLTNLRTRYVDKMFSIRTRLQLNTTINFPFITFFSSSQLNIMLNYLYFIFIQLTIRVTDVNDNAVS